MTKIHIFFTVIDIKNSSHGTISSAHYIFFIITLKVFSTNISISLPYL